MSRFHTISWSNRDFTFHIKGDEVLDVFGCPAVWDTNFSPSLMKNEDHMRAQYRQDTFKASDARNTASEVPADGYLGAIHHHALARRWMNVRDGGPSRESSVGKRTKAQADAQLLLGGKLEAEVEGWWTTGLMGGLYPAVTCSTYASGRPPMTGFIFVLHVHPVSCRRTPLHQKLVFCSNLSAGGTTRPPPTPSQFHCLMAESIPQLKGFRANTGVMRSEQYDGREEFLTCTAATSERAVLEIAGRNGVPNASLSSFSSGTAKLKDAESFQADFRDRSCLLKRRRRTRKTESMMVASSRKFEAVEEATAAIADIIARDVHQGQGPDTVKKIASLRLNLTIPRFRDFVRATMKGLVGQKPSDMRRPGRGKGPKIRTALNAIGIFQEIHVDGHEKLGEKALWIGSGIGIDIYGMRDHVGKVPLLCLRT
ncbi:hypothetical protein B0H13DRAFT_1867128 [Mycena leptocephala]|nr:hypothetical protein B0H13DRAFT_1867128 [Mycena leptocephala]